MATTPNYSWVMPDPTDFVTDLPADFEIFGDAVDASLYALSPGTTAGDLDYYTSSTAKARLGIGTAGQVLQVNGGATAPEWGTPAATTPPFVGCELFLTGSQSIANATFTVVNFSATDYIDTDAFHDPASNNSRITIPAGKDGKYLVFAQGFFADFNTDPARADVFILLNGTRFSSSSSNQLPSRTSLGQQAIIDLVATDYVEIQVYHIGGTNTDLWGTSALSPARGTRFGVQYLGV